MRLKTGDSAAKRTEAAGNSYTVTGSAIPEPSLVLCPSSELSLLLAFPFRAMDCAAPWLCSGVS